MAGLSILVTSVDRLHVPALWNRDAVKTLCKTGCGVVCTLLASLGVFGLENRRKTIAHQRNWKMTTELPTTMNGSLQETMGYSRQVWASCGSHFNYEYSPIPERFFVRYFTAWLQAEMGQQTPAFFLSLRT